MTFAQVQNGTQVTGSTSGSVTTLALTLPSASTAGTLLVACLVAGEAGVPAKITTVTAGGSNPNTSPGWEWCCTSVNGAGGGGQQVEIWCYRKNPGGITATTWTIQSGQGFRGHMMEFSSTLAYQVMELFPGLSTSVTAGDTSFPVSMGNPVGAGELAVALFGDNFSTGTACTFTAPAGWTLGRTTSTQSIQNHWISIYQTTAAAGAVSVTQTGSTGTNELGWEAALVVFREASSVRSRVGSSLAANTYNDQASFGFAGTKTGSAKEMDVFVGRPFATSVQVSYQTEGAHLTSAPSGDMTELSNMGAQIVWATKPRRTGLSGFTTVAAEQAAVDQDLTIVKQSGITGFICTSYNEMQLGGTNGPFGNDTYLSGADPYGSNNTATTARNHWLTYWANYQPIYAAHGIPVYIKPAYASGPTTVSWVPPAGTVSGVIVDYYYPDFKKGLTLDASPGNDPITNNALPSLQDVCDGVRNPDNSAASNTPIPLGLGEAGRSNGGCIPLQTCPTWAAVIAWSHTGGSTGHVRDFFAARLAAGKQNAPIVWFQRDINGGNWIHVPGFNGEDQTGITAELAAWSDSLAPQTTGTTVVVTTTTLPNAPLGVAYSQALQVTGGSAPYTWATLTGSLPTGLSLSAAGVISGTPTAAGTYTFTVKATDSGSNVGNSGTLQILVPGIAITTTTLPAATIGTAYTATLAETGGTGPFTWTVPGDGLPPGITLSAAGVLSGTTSAAPGSFPFAPVVTDSLSNTATTALTLTVSAGTTGGGGTPAPPAFGYPQLIVEAGFYTPSPVVQPGTFILDDPVNGVLDVCQLADATAWTDITTFVRSGNVTRASTRVQGPLRTYQAGTGSMALDNSDGRFDSSNPSGPYVTGGVSNIRPMVPFRVRAVFGSVVYGVFNGFADTWQEDPVDYDAGWSQVTVSGSDGFKVLAGITLPAVPAIGNNQPSGSRTAKILTDAGWFTDHRRIDGGNTSLQGTTYGDTVLNLLQLAADTEIGELYIDASGNLTFRERQAVLSDTRSTVSQATFGDLPGYTVLTADSMDFEGGTGTWTGAGNATISQTAAAAYTGTHALQMSSQASGNMTAAHCAAANILTQGLPVTPGQVIACSAYILAAASPRSVQVGAQFYDGTGTVVGATLYGTAFNEGATVWTPAASMITTPAGAAYARLSVLIQATGGAAEIHYVDGAQLYYPELACAAIGRANDDTTLCNDAQITASGSPSMQEAQDAPSIAKYLFPRSYARSDLILQSDLEAQLYAQWVVYVSKDAEDRFDTLVIDPVADPPNLFPQVLGREIGDRVTVIRRPQNSGAVIIRDCFIRGITHAIDVGAGTWQTTWDLQNASKYAGFLILDDPQLGKLNSGNKLAY